MATNELPKVYAYFRADYLHALRGVLDDIEVGLVQNRGCGLLIEPAADGGVLLIASNGRAMAILHDANGRANKPFRAVLPLPFRARCAPPDPVPVFAEGDYEIEPPEWMQPGFVVLTGLNAMMFAKMTHPGVEAWETTPALAHVWEPDDYRVDEEPLIDWRKPFGGAGASREIAFLAPRMLAQFDPISELRAEQDNGIRPSVALRLNADKDYPFLVTVLGLPNFVGAVMPMVEFEVPPLPDFIRRPAAEEEKAQ